MSTSGIKQGTWVVIADGEKVLYLVNRGDEEDMHLVVREKETQDNPQAQEWAANRPGRFNDGPGVHRSAVQDTDWHVLAKERFADDIADSLYQDAHAGAFEHLVIAASRPVLSELRESLHQVVTDKLVMDIPKVLTNHPLDEIETIIAKELSDAA